MTSGQHKTNDIAHRPANPIIGSLRWVKRLGVGIHVALLAAALVGVGFVAFAFVKAASKRKPPPVPPAMENVDWKSPGSSRYCLACHKTVGPAMAGLDVKHGHPQNVHLNESQLQAVADMGSAVGPDQTLICMSCHQLGKRAVGKYMLADTLDNSRLCQRCHPGHYARNTPHDLRESAPDEKNRLGETVAEGGPCSACHLAHRYARDFEPSPQDPDGRCTSCHRAYRVAAEHARETMDHPESRCQECHDPHDIAYGEFLKKPVDQLCITCHEGYADGPEAGTHPLGEMDYPVPDDLIAAGASVEPDPRKLTCVVCHTPHTANHESLLVLEPDSNRLCLTCHDDMRGDPGAPGAAPKHGQYPALNDEQLSVVRAWGTRVSPNNELLCVSCHPVHHGKSSLALLAFQPKYGETCGACHPNHDGVFGTSHDLRTNHPDERNIKGMTPIEYGACSACHLAHQYARETAPAPGDPSGQCVACHQPDSCASEDVVTGTLHPDTKCTDCHNPHERRFDNYLVDEQVAMCAKCHADQARLVGGPHDSSQNPDAWSKATEEIGGECLSCHVPHGGERSDLFRVRGDKPVGNHDDVCLHCHADEAWNAPTDRAAIHPHEIRPEQNKVELALVPKDEAGDMRMGCRTCHDPHGGAAPVHLARVAPDEETQDLCFHCHTEKKLIRLTGHSAERLGELGFDVDSCKPCHAMHATRDGTWGSMLSPRFLMDSCEAVDAGVGECVPCLACHHAKGPAPVRAIATHPPDKNMVNMIPPDSPGYLPLFNVDGRVDPVGNVTCRTCHLSHGRVDLLEQVAEGKPLSHAEELAIRTQVRPFITPNICTECHGNEARARFLFFHNPERRAFPRHDPAEQRPVP